MEVLHRNVELPATGEAQPLDHVTTDPTAQKSEHDPNVSDRRAIIAICNPRPRSLLCSSNRRPQRIEMAALIKAANAKIRSNPVTDYICSTRTSIPLIRASPAATRARLELFLRTACVYA